MSRIIPFTKMHGAGNDYIYVNTLLYSVPDPSAAAIAWSKPHFGIGSDGLVLIGRPSDPAKADYSMRIFNADGSEAMMCGNASRCIGKYVYEKGMTDKTVIRLETLSGVKVLHLHLSSSDEQATTSDDQASDAKPSGRKTVDSVTVDMLEPRFEVPEQFTGRYTDIAVPAALEAHLLPATIGENGAKGKFVSMGNPHYVSFVDDVAAIDITAIGKALETDKAFPERCNIEFAQPLKAANGVTTLRTRVWERGSGITMACGTGACATAVAAISLGLTKGTDDDRTCDIVMDGGTLHINWSEADNHVYMTGPAAFAFEGEIPLPE